MTEIIGICNTFFAPVCLVCAIYNAINYSKEKGFSNWLAMIGWSALCGGNVVGIIGYLKA